MFSRKLTSSNRVVEKKRNETGESTSLQTWPFLQPFWNTLLWGARTQLYPNLCWKIKQATLSRMKKVEDNYITITPVFFVHLLSICTALNDWWKKLSANQFQGVHKNDNLIVEDLLTPNILLYYIVNADGNIVGELARRSEQKYRNTAQLKRCNNHMC